MSIFPPILSSQIESIEGTWMEEDANGNRIFKEPFPKPLGFQVYGTLSRSTNIEDIGHIQVLIRRQIDLVPWAPATVTELSPDKEILYLPAENFEVKGNEFRVIILRSEIGEWFDSGLGNVGQFYTIQVRFGKNEIPADFLSNFANWRQRQVAEGAFGEWSNTQRMFVYANKDVSTPKLDHSSDLVPTFSWSYTPISQDPLSEVIMEYYYLAPGSGAKIFKTKRVPFQASSGNSSGASGEIKLNVARFRDIYFNVKFVTKNNTVWNIDSTIKSAKSPLKAMNVETLWSPGSVNSVEIERVEGAEIGDGILQTKFSGEFVHYDVKVYRVDLSNLETVELLNIPRTVDTPGSEISVKDYGVEMGAEYAYVGVAYGYIGSDYLPTHSFGDLTPLKSNDRRNYRDYRGYARQMNFDGTTFLSSKFQQLKLVGNVSLSGFKLNTSDTITPTINSRYPYYSRSSQSRYRSFNLDSIITASFDDTHTFLNLAYPDEPLREIDYEVEETHEARTSNLILLERKFREAVLDWLTNGKPKLFRSETEGNMIVMLTNVGLTPFNSSRRVYSFSATVTELAEHNLENLLLYGLTPQKISSSVGELWSGAPDQEWIRTGYQEGQVSPWESAEFRYLEREVSSGLSSGGE